MATRPCAKRWFSATTAQTLGSHGVLVEQHVPVLGGDLLVVPAFVVVLVPGPGRHGDADGLSQELGILRSMTVRYSAPISYHWPC